MSKKELNTTKIILFSTIVLIALVTFVLGTTTGYFIYKSNTPPTITEKKEDYPYISSRILLEEPNDVIISFTELKIN